MKNGKVYFIYIAVALLFGGLAGVISMNGIQNYAVLNKSIIAPPGWVFPIVWTILYILMAIGASRYQLKTGEVSWVYVLQLIVNFIWPFLFFRLNLYLVAFIWLILLLILVIKMAKEFYKVDKLAGYLQIPYILWLIFAGYLNLSVYLLNR